MCNPANTVPEPKISDASNYAFRLKGIENDITKAKLDMTSSYCQDKDVQKTINGIKSAFNLFMFKYKVFQERQESDKRDLDWKLEQERAAKCRIIQHTKNKPAKSRYNGGACGGFPKRRTIKKSTKKVVSSKKKK